MASGFSSTTSKHFSSLVVVASYSGGLDEVPTEQGRAAVSRLLEDCVRRFPNSRFVVTSRVRAYTGDTILKGEFIRCDIQPFDEDDRRQFLRNWVALLFKVPRERVLTEGTEARREFDSLTHGIENNDRIRPLAVNPLLLTVIATVHWNRKRLPEQRVHLYDECVDVLLGQRKEAEHVQLGRKAGSLDEHQEQQQYEERAWVRKRFAEIALHILSSEGDEAARADVVKLLVPRFRDRGATNEEQAIARAELFLERQELRSGLLVSRRSHSYRFVHLTFQEYLAAWHLSNQEVEQTLQLIQPHLRRQKWFEVLQLLGGEWARQSDEKLDRYVAWLLDQQGSTIAARAPVIVLCANIVKDTAGVAELKPETRQFYRTAIEGTLAAFRPRSGVPNKNQLEILEALGRLGAAVKGHLIEAAKSGLYTVRRRAIEMLLPHLSDDELFSLQHILLDRSREPIKTFLTALIQRDSERAISWLQQRDFFDQKTCEAVCDLIPLFTAYADSNARFDLLSTVFRRGRDGRVRGEFLAMLAYRVKKDEVRIWQLMREAVTKDPDNYVRRIMLLPLAWEQMDDPTTWQLIREVAMKDPEAAVRSEACGVLLCVSNCDELQRRLMLRDLDQPSWYLDEGLIWYAPEVWVWYDPKEPITSRRVADVAQKLDLSIDEVRRQYEELADQLQIALNLEWRKPS